MGQAERPVYVVVTLSGNLSPEVPVRPDSGGDDFDETRRLCRLFINAPSARTASTRPTRLVSQKQAIKTAQPESQPAYAKFACSCPSARRSVRVGHAGIYVRVPEGGPKRMNVTHFPSAVFALTLIIFGASAWIGTIHLGRRRKLEEDVRPNHAIILTATLTLFGHQR